MGRRKRQRSEKQETKAVKRSKVHPGFHSSKSRQLQSDAVNLYEGWRPQQHAQGRSKGSSAGAQKGAKLERVDVAQLDPERFWTDYVSQRRPVVLCGTCNENQLIRRNLTLDYMASKAGDVKVSVERRSSKQESFGKGNKTQMLFKEFLTGLQDGTESLYLTTQDAEEEEDGFPAVMAPLTQQFSDDIVERPELLGNLIPQSINLWMGSTTAGASSGLHHDYHDNLYVLLRGRKRFRLWSPSDAGNMYINSQLKTIHPNGRIVYHGQGDVLADGALKEDVDSSELGLIASKAQAAAMSDSEEELEALLNRADSHNSDSGQDWDGHDDFDDCQEGDQELADKPEHEDEDADKEEPLSFSQVDLCKSLSEISAQFPAFPGVHTALTCELQPGELLYLPAGWFHEVTSQNHEGAAARSEWHMAVNYWFHPPDVLRSSKKGFLSPYKSSFWPDLWKRRKAG